jgi:hypothetical protein
MASLPERFRMAMTELITKNGDAFPAALIGTSAVLE